MVSSVGSQVESAIFKRVIGALCSDVEFGGDVYVEDNDGSCVGGGVRATGGEENGMSGPECSEEGAAEAVTDC